MSKSEVTGPHFPDEDGRYRDSVVNLSEKSHSDPESNSTDTKSVSDDNSSVRRTYRGIERIEAVNNVLTSYGRVTLFGGKFELHPLKALLLIFLFIQGYASGLDGLMSGSMQTYGANHFHTSPEEGTLNTVKGVVAAAVIVPYARLSDRIGRIEAWLLALMVFIVGRVVCAATPTWGGLFSGVVIWQFGYAGFRFLSTALTADISDLRNRVFAMNIFLIPIIINLWVSSYIVQALIGAKLERLANWRWGYGIGCISVPVTTFLLVSPYIFAQTIAYRKKTLPSFRFRSPGESLFGAIRDFAERIDLIGVLLFAATLSLILIPISIAGGLETKWEKGYIIAMICVGGGLFFVWGIWEWFFSKAPFIPRSRLEPSFWAAVAIEFCWRFAISVELTYVRDVLLVAFNQTPRSTQRLGQLYDFMQACTNIGVGVILHFWPYPKPFVFGGSLIALLGMGLMCKYRTAYDGGISGYIAADVLIGLGGGMVRFPMWTLVHAGLPHEQMAVATGFMMSMYQVGAAVGSAVATAVWTQKLPKRLVNRLGSKLGKAAYQSPVTFIKKYKMGTPQRTAMIQEYSYLQQRLMYISVSFAAFVVVLTVFIRNYTVRGKRQTYTDEDREEELKRITTGRWWWVHRIIGY